MAKAEKSCLAAAITRPHNPTSPLGQCDRPVTGQPHGAVDTPTRPAPVQHCAGRLLHQAARRSGPRAATGTVACASATIATCVHTIGRHTLFTSVGTHCNHAARPKTGPAPLARQLELLAGPVMDWRAASILVCNKDEPGWTWASVPGSKRCVGFIQDRAGRVQAYQHSKR
jgi:hypothetical protein